ncbi:hypothetical protein [Nostoc sp.]|nr:hypothetical protein [Nostoc sp.]
MYAAAGVLLVILLQRRCAIASTKVISCYVYNLHNQGGQDAHPTGILKKY